MTTHSGVGPIVAALGLTQIIGYGTLYYSFGVLAPSMAADFGWSQEWVYGALSVSLLLGGCVAPLSGKLADRYGGGEGHVMGVRRGGAGFVALRPGA